tara:strand:- start:4689 stop:5312 length:624 start_codon:yes stop_codon:yes gene_type:complete
MGNIWKFDIAQILEKYPRIRSFVETGTCEGAGVRFAQTLGFEQIHSIEIMEELWQHCKNQTEFSEDDKVNLHLGHSPSVLKDILQHVGPRLPNDDPGDILFWLDAHFPGVDTVITKKGIHDESDPERRCPLHKEIEAIVSTKRHIGSVFIIDDLRVYEDGPFASGNWPERHLYGGDGIQFIFDLLGDTHNISRYYCDNGYIVAIPMN